MRTQQLWRIQSGNLKHRVYKKLWLYLNFGQQHTQIHGVKFWTTGFNLKIGQVIQLLGKVTITA